MSKTIVQEYGPIYGEAVNGTVMGRPNGSVYVPLTNKIRLSIDADYQYLCYFNDDVLINCDSTGLIHWDQKPIKISADSQDPSSNMVLQAYTDAEETTLAGIATYVAGNFNLSTDGLLNAIAGLVDEQTLYLRAQLFNGGVAVATSDTVEVHMVVTE